MIGKTTLEVDANVMDPRLQTELMIQRCVLPAMRKAIDIVAAQVRQNLMSHRSDRTGTREKMSEKTRAYHDKIRDHLIEEVQTQVYYKRRENVAVGRIYFNDNAAWVANFLEYGHPLMRWGEDQHHLIDETITLKKTFKFDKTFSVPLGKRSWGLPRLRRRIRKQRTFKKDITIRLLSQNVPAYPFLRPAYESKREAALRTFENELRKCFKREQPQGPIRKTLIIGTIGAIAAATAYGLSRQGRPGSRPGTSEPILIPFPTPGTVGRPMAPAAQRTEYYHTIAA